MAEPKIGSIYVDVAYSTMFIENLRPQSFLVDGVTYTSKYIKGDPKAGIVYFHQLNVSEVVSEAVGGKYNHEAAADSLKAIYLTNAFKKSTELLGVTEAQMGANLKDQVATEQAQDVRVGKDKCAIAGLVYGGTASLDTEEITSLNVSDKIIEAKQALKRKNVNANVLLVSPEVEGFLLTSQLKQGVVTPVTNDELVKAGVFGKYLGMYLFSRNELGDPTNTAVVYRDNAQRAVDLSNTEFVMYNSEFFGAADCFVEARMGVSNEFAGMYANIEQDSGFGVLNKDAVLVKNKMGA